MVGGMCIVWSSAVRTVACLFCCMQALIDGYMSKIRSIISQQRVSTRIKFMLQDVVELRNVRTVTV